MAKERTFMLVRAALLGAACVAAHVACLGEISEQLQAPPVEVASCDAVGPAPLRRLSAAEYNRAVNDLLGDASAPARLWPAAGSSTGFDNDVVGQSATAQDIEAFVTSAEAVADGVLARLGTVLPCEMATLTTDQARRACASAYIDKLARRAYRRPLTADDRTTLLAVYDSGFAIDGFDGGIRAITETVLESPSFFYKIEEGVGTGENGVVALSGYEVATRLSFFITGSIPDEPLLAAAENGMLATREGVEAETRRLLATPEARARVRDFFRQFLELDKIMAAEKDPSVLPSFDVATRADLLASVEAFVEHVVFDAEERTLRELMSASYNFVTARTAPLYGLTSIAVTPEKVALDPTQRAGILTDAGLLAALAKRDSTSPIQRGVFVRQALLCQPLGAPPNADVAVVPAADPDKTTRERFADHTSDPSCAGCHRLIDPIGFGLEAFDAVGRYREQENGLVIDTTGTLIGTDVDGELTGAIDLATRLSTSDYVAACVADRWIMFAQGRNTAKECLVPALEARFAETSGDFTDLILAIATDETFRARPAVVPGSCTP